MLTPVDLDHQSWLGSTREAIGLEKAGVFRAGRPVVIADPNPPASVLERVADLGSPSARWGVDFGLRHEGVGREAFITGFDQDTAFLLQRPLPVAAPSFFGALQAWAALGNPLTSALIDAALAMTPPPGRQQWRALAGQALLFDVAHNPHAAAFLAERLDAPLDLAVFGSYADKDAEGMVRALAPKVRRWLFVPTPGPRGQTGEALAARLAPLCKGVGQPFDVLPSLGAEALQGALAASRSEGLKRIGFLGSFSVVSAAEAALLPPAQGAES
jgi:dihydrofolate synthase/folylpolyglutamate synthase